MLQKLQKILLLCCAPMLLLSSCGIKPSAVEPSAENNKVSFPRTYPDKETDPKPLTYPPMQR